jgi:hypothetical protein
MSFVDSLIIGSDLQLETRIAQNATPNMGVVRFVAPNGVSEAARRKLYVVPNLKANWRIIGAGMALGDPEHVKEVVEEDNHVDFIWTAEGDGYRFTQAGTFYLVRGEQGRKVHNLDLAIMHDENEKISEAKKEFELSENPTLWLKDAGYKGYLAKANYTSESQLANRWLVAVMAYRVGNQGNPPFYGVGLSTSYPNAEAMKDAVTTAYRNELERLAHTDWLAFAL